jgi:toxin-antitoxin system PIN domain toxin
VWLALVLSEHVHHRRASSWFDAVGEPRAILFCRATRRALPRLLTNSAVLAPYGNPPLTNEQAWAVYEAFRADGRVAPRRDEPEGLEASWRGLALRDTASPKLWMDAYLAAFAITAGCRLVSTDRAFSQLAGLDSLILG